jgi:vitamin B12 transporter
MKKEIFIAAAVLFSNHLSAQQDSAKDLNEVFISANKFPNKTSMTGKVVVVITRDQLDKSGGKDLSQILNEQAGMYINGANSNPGKDKSIFLRGAKIDYTLITVDGVPLYDPSGIGSNFDIRLLSIDNIERIEILKGSQSTLYGSDAIAGVINIITRKDNKKPLVPSALLSFGSFNTLHANAGLSGRNEKFDYNLSYTYFKTDGINEATDTLVTPHKTDKDGYEQNNFNASFSIHPIAKIMIRPYLRYTKIHGAIDQDAFIDELDYRYTSENLQFGLKNEFDLGKAKLNILYNYSNTKRDYIDDSTESRNGYATYSHGLYRGREHYAEGFVVYPINQIIKLTAGVDMRNSNTGQSYLSIDPFFGPYKTEMNKDSVKQNQFGVYAAAVLSATNGLSAELGGRYNHHSIYGGNAVFNFNPSYFYNKQWKFFVNISSGYKVPTLYQLYSEYGNRSLKPESSINLEGGIQYFSKENKWMARATYFDRHVKDLIIFYTSPAYVSFYINQDKQKDHGVELEASASIGKKASLKVFYTYVDGNITTKLAGKDTTYFNLIRRPKSSMGLSLSSSFGKRFYASTHVQVTGERKDFGYDPFFNRFDVTLDPFVLWSAYAQYSFLKNRIKVFADLQNITNAKYSEVYGFNTMGFNATGGVRFSF